MVVKECNGSDSLATWEMVQQKFPYRTTGKLNLKIFLKKENSPIYFLIIDT
jgi:hypothetical protein